MGKSTSEHPGYCDTRGAAAYTGMSKTWLEKARHYGRGPVYRKIGSAVRYAYSDLDAWMADQARTCTRDDVEAA